jgi:hypothetical protein
MGQQRRARARMGGKWEGRGGGHSGGARIRAPRAWRSAPEPRHSRAQSSELSTSSHLISFLFLFFFLLSFMKFFGTTISSFLQCRQGPPSLPCLPGFPSPYLLRHQACESSSALDAPTPPPLWHPFNTILALAPSCSHFLALPPLPPLGACLPSFSHASLLDFCVLCSHSSSSRLEWSRPSVLWSGSE